MEFVDTNVLLYAYETGQEFDGVRVRNPLAG